MGLSTKQVSNDHALYWGQTLLESGSVDQLPNPAQSRRQQQQQQNQQQPSEPLKCPRCSSVNTKFCYYNNYNKSQPRHFCKDCKRHWTKGGTLRNVPVGGGRKNKRLKASNAATITAAAANTATKNASHPIVPHHGQPEDRRNFPLPDDQKNISEVLCQALINNPSSIPYDAITSLSGKNLMSNKNSFSSTLSPLLSQLPQDHNLQFSFSNLSPFDTIPCSSFLSSNLSVSNPYDYTGELDQMESSSTVTTVTPPASSAFSHSWQCPTTSSSMPEIQNYWNWNDIEHFVSSDINISWDDIEMKP